MGILESLREGMEDSKKDMSKLSSRGIIEQSRYTSWKNKFNSDLWRKLCMRYANSHQFALLCAMSVVGVPCSSWDRVFDDVLAERSGFSGVSRSLWDISPIRARTGGMEDMDIFHQINMSFYYKPVKYDIYSGLGYWGIFAQKLVEGGYSSCLPPHFPEWLLEYGYTHYRYINDLNCLWRNVYNDYYVPWSIERFGEDMPPVAPIRLIGEATRHEIDSIASHATRRLT